MDLVHNTPENIDYMISQIVNKLKMVNIGAVKVDNLSGEKYEDLRDIYEMVMKKEHFSPNEMQALAEEIGRLRN